MGFYSSSIISQLFDLNFNNIVCPDEDTNIKGPWGKICSYMYAWYVVDINFFLFIYMVSDMVFF